MREHWSPIFELLLVRPDQCGDVIGDFEAAMAEIDLATAEIEAATDDTGTEKDWASTIIGVRALIDVDRGHLGAAAARLAEWASKGTTRAVRLPRNRARPNRVAQRPRQP